MKVDVLTLNRNIEEKLQQFQQERDFAGVAKLVSYAFQVNDRWRNVRIFGYLPKLFRTVEIADSEAISSQDIFIGEPVIYRIKYPSDVKLYGFDYYYIYCYLKENSDRLNIHFQSAHPKYKDYTIEEYNLDSEKITFEGSTSSFADNNLSTISISDPGHFVPTLTSSYYVGSPELNFPQAIAQVIDKITNLAGISLDRTLLFGSSAGTFGALLSSTYLSQKTNVLAVNSQIYIQYRKDILQACFNLQEPKEALKKFSEQLSCLRRFQQDLSIVPNIYILANVNDNLYSRNFSFYQNYLEKFTAKGLNNQSVFDSYYGVDGHGRPEPHSLKAKIRIAREVLTMKSTV